MSLLASLPAPTRQQAPAPAAAAPAPVAAPTSMAVVGREPPPYPRRAGWVPRKPEDFSGGGAYPEIHVAQYPLDMGRPDATKSGKTLAVGVDADGKIAYDAIVKQGANRDKIVYSDHKALVPKIDELSEANLAKPDEEELEKTRRETAEALARKVEGKLAAANPKSLPSQPGGAQYIKYTPSQQGAAFASGAQQRIIKMQDMPVDPLEPPKFRHVKVPRGAGSPPVPVMHSPPRPVTAEDQKNWKIPPCISNWKNPKGYTIPLDKRLAADGRGLQEVRINDKFAQFSEALYVAESKAREAIEMRGRIQRELLAKEKAKKEAELRELAQRARLERGGGLAARADTGGYATAAAGAGGHAMDEDEELPGPPPLAPPPPQFEETAQEREERRRRDEIREERRRERERERRLEEKEAHGGKKSKITRDRERDISEKIALGMAAVGGAGEVQYDQRLFNQDQGMGTGFGGDDGYNVYDKALFADRSATTSHRPKAVDDEEGGAAAGARGTERFKPDRGFAGADAAPAGPRTKAVEFEKHAEAEADPFGLDQFLDQVKGGGAGRKKGALDGIGQGGMRAGGGGGSYDDYAGGRGRNVQFTSGSGR